MVNPCFTWCVSNVPPPNYESRFYPYSYVFKEAYGYEDRKKAGQKVREDLEEYIYDLCRYHNCAVQLGSSEHGQRGIRIMNLKSR